MDREGAVVVDHVSSVIPRREEQPRKGCYPLCHETFEALRRARLPPSDLHYGIYPPSGGTLNPYPLLAAGPGPAPSPPPG